MASASLTSGVNNVNPQSVLLQQLKSTIICSICTDVMTEPVIACSKLHTFDVRCIAQWAEYHRTCPECREALRPTFETNRLAIQNLEIYQAALKAEQENQTKPIPLPAPPAPSVKISSPRHPPIIDAIQKDDENEVKRVISQGGNVNQVDSAGYNPIFYARSNGVIELLLKAGARIKRVPTNTSLIQQKAFLDAISKCDLVTAKQLLENGLADIDGYDEKLRCRPLHLAIKALQPIMVLLLIRAGVNIEAEIVVPISMGRHSVITAFQYALNYTYDNHETIEMLLQAGANIKTPGPGRISLHGSCNEIAFIEAAKRYKPSIIRLFIQRGASVNTADSEGWTALHNAAVRSLASVEILVASGANVNAKTCYDVTPLWMAAQCAQVPIARYLIEHGARMNDHSMGTNPLHPAVQHGHAKMVEFLIDEGMSANIKDKDGQTPLFMACAIGASCIEVIELLLQKNANPNIPNNQGTTPLLEACKQFPSSTRIVQLLLAKGADPNKANNEGVSPVSYARQYHRELLNLFPASNVSIWDCLIQ
jgi:ankyrin repeat protein